VSAFLGPGINNMAEYRAAIAGVKAALEHGVEEIELCMDRQLVVEADHGGIPGQEGRVKAHAMRVG
jgi:ribonuclease HI